MRPQKKRWLFVSSLFSLMLVTQHSIGDQIRISTFVHDTVQVDVSAKIMTNVYRRLGHEMTLIRFPGKRSLVEANQGSVNGELIRVKAAATSLPNLKRIPISVGNLKVMALTLTESPRVVGMGGLIGKKIGIVRGVELTDRLTKNLPRQTLNTIDGLFQSLLSKRVEVILFPDLDAKEYLTIQQLTPRIVINSVPIIEVPLYHFIHKSKPVLIQKVTDLLEILEVSGELDAIIYSAEQARY